MTITCKISEVLDSELEAVAANRRVTKSELVRESLERYLKRARQNPRLTLHDAMKDCCGVIKKAPRDYATNPKYLEGFGK